MWYSYFSQANYANGQSMYDVLGDGGGLGEGVPLCSPGNVFIL